MELRATRELRRSAQLEKAAPKKADASAGAQAQSALRQRKTPADRLTLSRQALDFVQEQNRRMWEQAQEREQRRQSRMEDSLSALESSKQELDFLNKQTKVMNKCLKIAASIMKGNRVPPEDLEYLMKNDPEGYKLALAMCRENPDPKDEKSVLDEEDRNGGSTEHADGGGEAPSVEGAGGGGETSAQAE